MVINHKENKEGWGCSSELQDLPSTLKAYSLAQRKEIKCPFEMLGQWLCLKQGGGTEPHVGELFAASLFGWGLGCIPYNDMVFYAFALHPAIKSTTPDCEIYRVVWEVVGVLSRRKCMQAVPVSFLLLFWNNQVRLSRKKKNLLGMVVPGCIPALGRLRQEDH